MHLLASPGTRPCRAALRPWLLSLAASAALVAEPAHGQDPTAKVDAIFGFATAETPGCAVGVSKHGRVLVDRAYGLADVSRRVPLSPRSVFDIGSTQKQFVAASILLLAEDGRLALTDDIRRYFPELPEYGHTITIDHLLTHTSGIRDWTGLLPIAEEGADVLQLILRQRGLNFTPGEQWSYSNSGYVLLKELVGRVSGVPFAEFARTRLFEPLGMTSSAYVPDILQGEGEIARAYEKQGDGWNESMRLGNQRGGGAVISTASDLLKWNEALTHGRLGAYVTQKLQEPSRLASGRKLTYARGLILDEEIPGGPMISHSGGAAGYSTWLGRFMADTLSVAVLCNFEPVSATNLAGRVADLFLPAADPGSERPGPTAAPGVDVAGRAGLYFAERTGEPLRLGVNGGRLVVAGGGPLVPVSADRFQPQRRALFFRSGDAFELTFLSDSVLEFTSMEGETMRYLRAQPWTASAADLQAFEGRYANREVGSVFEVVPGPNGIVVRLEHAPENAIPLEPVARDTYMRSLQIVRFRRDASGAVTGLEYGNPLVRSLEFTRLGARAADSPPLQATSAAAATPAPPATPATPAPPLEALVGEYELAPGRTIVVTLEDGQLYGEPTNNPKRLLVHSDGATFTVAQAPSPTTVTFTLDADGRATALVMRQNGNERTLRRVR